MAADSSQLSRLKTPLEKVMQVNKDILDKVSAGDLEGAAASVRAILDQKRDKIMAEGSAFLANSVFGECSDQFSARPAATIPEGDNGDGTANA